MKCTVCNDEFEGRSDARYCSSTCRSKANRATDNIATDNIATDNRATDNIATDNVIDIDIPCNVYSALATDNTLDLVKDLKLNVKNDLGISSWSEHGIMILPEITVKQVQTLCSLIRAKNGSKQRCYA